MNSITRSKQTRDPTPQSAEGPSLPRLRPCTPTPPHSSGPYLRHKLGNTGLPLKDTRTPCSPIRGWRYQGSPFLFPRTSQPALPTRMGIERHRGQLSMGFSECTCHLQPQTQPGIKGPHPPPTHLVSAPACYSETWTYNGGPTLLLLTHHLWLPMAPSQVLTFQPGHWPLSFLPSAQG